MELTLQGNHYSEKKILELVEYLQSKTPLKTFTEIAYLVSRLVLVFFEFQFRTIPDKISLVKSYEKLKKKYDLEKNLESNFSVSLESLGMEFEIILEMLLSIIESTKEHNNQELILEALFMGRFESNDMAGMNFAPVEVTNPIATICKQIQFERKIDDSSLFIGDITSGTGKMIDALFSELLKEPAFKRFKIKYFLSDRSSFFLELGKIQFIIKNKYKNGIFHVVNDSITDNIINSYKGKFDIIFTNPQDGNRSYSWNYELKDNFPKSLLTQLGMKNKDSSIDPTEIYFFKNLDLLKEDGILGIILPDSILYSDNFKKSVLQYESIFNCKLKLRSLISLPSRTFSLGGTIIKTSFLLLQKSGIDSLPPYTYYAEANHIGFIKKGNYRVPDPKGNELQYFSDEYLNRKSYYGTWKKIQRFSNLTPIFFQSKKGEFIDRDKLLISDIAEIVKETDRYHRSDNSMVSFHISPEDISPIGIIDLYRARQNSHLTEGWICLPGDVLISPLNSEIWRTTVVPVFLQAKWVCSPQIYVIRIMRKDIDPYNVFLGLLESDLSNQFKNISKNKWDISRFSFSLELKYTIDFGFFKQRRNMMYADMWNEILELT